MPFFKLQYSLKLSDRQMRSIKTAINKRHKEDNWLKQMQTPDGSSALYIYLEGADWVESVYLNPAKDSLSAEIEFTLRHIRRLENELGKREPCRIYFDLNRIQLCQYFECTERYMFQIINRLKKVKPETYYKQNGQTFITAEGVKWMEENVFKKKYLINLQRYKRRLQQIKKERREDDC